MARKTIEAGETEVDTEARDVVLGGDQRSSVPMNVTNTQSVALGHMSGDLGLDDLRLPRLQMAYGVGKLSEFFNPGDMVLAEDNLLVKKGEPLYIVVLSALQYWKEYFDTYTPGLVPRTFLTEQEVLQAGETTRWANGKGPSFSRALNLKLLIQRPKDVLCALFGITLVGEDRVFAPAVWDIDKTAYAKVAPIIQSADQFSLRKDGLLRGIFEVVTKSDKRNTNIIPVPTIKLSGYNTDEEIAAIRALFAPTPATTAPVAE